MATLDDDPGVRPDAHGFIVDKAPWFTATDDLPQYRATCPGRTSCIRDSRQELMPGTISGASRLMT